MRAARARSVFAAGPMLAPRRAGSRPGAGLRPTAQAAKVAGMNRWLQRLSFSLIVVAMVLIWEAWQEHSGRHGQPRLWRVGLLYAGAFAVGLLGMYAVSLRHRRSDGPDDDASR